MHWDFSKELRILFQQIWNERQNRKRIIKLPTHFIQTKHLTKLILTFWFEIWVCTQNSFPSVLAPCAYNTLLQARSGFRSCTISFNTLAHLYSCLHSGAVHISPQAAKTALLQVLWTGVLRVTLMSALTALLDIHLRLLSGGGSFSARNEGI